MMRRIRGHLSPPMLIAMVALFVSLTGAAVANLQIRDNTINTRDIKDNQVNTKDLRDGSVRDDDVNDSVENGLQTRWLLIDEQGQIEEQSGGFTIIDAYVTNNNVYVDAGSPLADHGLFATVALQNKIDVDGMAGVDSDFDGEVSVARCQTAAVECAPPGAKNANAFVVSPRNSDGSATGPASRKRVYVQITE